MMMVISFNLYSALLARGGGQHNRRDYHCRCNRSLHRYDCTLCGFAHQFSPRCFPMDFFPDDRPERFWIIKVHEMICVGYIQ